MNSSKGDSSVAPTLADFVAINREIGALVRARLPLESQLARIGADLPGKSGELAMRISNRMEAGETLSAAIDAECAALPAAYRAAVVAGLESGQLGGAVESLVDTATRLDLLRRVTGLALLYPLIVVLIACSLFAFVFSRVIPQFDWFQHSPFGPFAVLARAPWIGKAFTLVIPGAILLLFVLWWWRSERQGWSLLALPGISRVNRWSQAATFAELLRLLVERSMPLSRALVLAGDATSDKQIRAAAREMAAQVERGEINGAPVGEASSIGPPGLPFLVRVALRHAADRRLLSASLSEAATAYRERALRAAEWYAEFVPIVLTLLIAGTVAAAFALLVFWPYATMLHDLSSWNWR